MYVSLRTVSCQQEDREECGDKKHHATADTGASKRDVIVAPVSLTTFRTLPVLVPDVVTQLHAGSDGLVADLLRGAPLAHVVLLSG